MGDSTEAIPVDQPKRSSRRVLPMILIVLATIIGIVSVPALWAKRQLLENQTWTNTSEELIQNPAIQSAVSNFIVTAIYDNVDVQAEIADRLPPNLAPLAGPVSGALRNAAGDITLKALEQPKIQDAWVSANSAAQAKLVALLENKGQFVSTGGGVVTLDLKSLLTSVTAQLGLPSGLADKLPASASSIEIMQSNELAAAQKGVHLLETAAYVLSALALLLYIAAIFLAGDRRRQTLRAVGYSFIFIGIVVLFARGAGGNVVVSSLSSAASSDAAVKATYDIGTSLLLETGQSLLTYGIVIVIAAWLAGPTAWATSLRRAATPYLRQPRYAYAGLAVLLLLVFWWDPVIATHRLVPSLLLIAFAVLGTEMLRRQVIREFPDRVQTGTPEGMARDMWSRMQEARDARAARREPATAVAGGGDARIAQLEQLGKLHESGVLSDEELAAEKQRILKGAPAE